MKAVTQVYRTGRVCLIESPPPELRPGGVLVQSHFSVLSAGTEKAKVELARKTLLGKARARPEAVRQVIRSLSDSGALETYRKVQARLNEYSPLGYSSSGEVLAVGSGVDHLRPGQRVACAGAGFANHAEVAFIPKHLCVPVPPEVSSEAAAFTALGAIALQGIRQAEPGLRDHVLVIGLGILGLLSVQMLRAAGCSVAGVDFAADRVRLALELGAQAAWPRDNRDLNAALRAFAPHGFDVALITAATRTNDPLLLAGAVLRDRGRVVVVGDVAMAMQRDAFYEKELYLCMSRSYGPGRYDPTYEEGGVDYPYGYVRWTEQRNMEAFLEMVATDRVCVEPLITHRFPLEDAERAYHLLAGDIREPFLGIVLEYARNTRAAHAEAGSVPSRGSRRHLATVQVGLVGAGSFARSTLLPALRRKASVVAVATESGLSAASQAKELAARAVSVEELLKDANVNLVVIATRHDSHAELACRALQAGKAVFVEKPLALSEEQLQALEQTCHQQASRESQPFLMVGFNRRFSPHVRRIQEALARRSEPLSLHYRINAGWVPRSHWSQAPSGGGRIIGELCHFLDLVQYLAQSPIQTMGVEALPNLEKYSDDNLSLLLRLADGSVATIHYVACGDRSAGKERLEIYCQGTTIWLDDFRRLLIVRDGRRRTWRTFSPAKGHPEEIESLIGALKAGQPSPISWEETVAVTRLTFQVLQTIQGWSLGEA